MIRREKDRRDRSSISWALEGQGTKGGRVRGRESGLVKERRCYILQCTPLPQSSQSPKEWAHHRPSLMRTLESAIVSSVWRFAVHYSEAHCGLT